MPIPMYAAHSPGQEQLDWEDQQTHRDRVVAALARIGVTTGLAVVQATLHDLGKYLPSFQAYIRASHAGQPSQRSPHAAHGGVIAALLSESLRWPGTQKTRGFGALLAAAPIIAHHTGLHDQEDLRSCLQDPVLNQAAREALAVAITDHHPSVQELAALMSPPPNVDLADPCQVDLAIRMLTSQLVDADWTATEEHYRPSRASLRTSRTLLEIAERFEPGRSAFLAAQAAGKAAPPSEAVLAVRHEVYQACLVAGQLAAGRLQHVYRLTVPTGGGKTLSVMAFALTLAQERARHHPQLPPISRVVMAVPLTSITDQNADVLRQVLGVDAVLEHHSALDPATRQEQPIHLRLAAENWDAPVIVTTTVQAIEVLGAAEPRRLRKLHRMRGCVLILDEVQALPTHLLGPIMALLREAAERHGFTVVLCSATQPPFEFEERLSLPDIQEINPAYPDHFRRLKRVTYHWLGELGMPALTARLQGHGQALTVMNTRREAVTLLHALGPDPAHYHLSTLMCGAHRRDSRTEMDVRLRSGQALRLVSTTVIEAGVEISFPVTYRQTAGFERLVQVAGRTNRDGEGRGDVFLFDLTGGFDGTEGYRLATRHTRALLRELMRHPETFSDAMHDPATMHRYFQDLLHDEALMLDKEDIAQDRRNLRLATISRKFRLIDDDRVSVLVPYGSRGQKLIRALRRKLSREGLLTPADRQRLQPYLVQIRQQDVSRLALEQLHDSLYVCGAGDYDQRLGLRLYDLD